MKLFITFIICSLIGFFLWNIEKQRENVTNAVQASGGEPRSSWISAEGSARVSSTPVARNSSEHANIDRTLHLVAEKWKSTDVNGDGKITV